MIIFRQRKVDVEKIRSLTQFNAWSWLKHKHYGVTFLYSEGYEVLMSNHNLVLKGIVTLIIKYILWYNVSIEYICWYNLNTINCHWTNNKDS